MDLMRLPTKASLPSKDSSFKKELIFFVVLFCLQFIFSTFNTANAASDSISIIYTGEKSYTRKVIDQLYKELDSLPISINTINLKHESLARAPLSNSSLIISLGTHATQETLKLKSKLPLLSLLIPSQAYTSLKNYRSADTPWKVIFIDQPISRQLHFIQAIFGNKKTIATILGPYSKSIENKLKKAAKRNGQNIKIESVKTNKQLIHSLRSLIQSSDILLAVPDPITFNRKNIRSILLMSYHQGVPLIGFSRSYVKAGAIGAIFSEAEKISSQAADIIKEYLNNKVFTSSTIYGRDYAIALNKNVARTLDIYLPSKETIHKKMLRLEK